MTLVMMVMVWGMGFDGGIVLMTFSEDEDEDDRNDLVRIVRVVVFAGYTTMTMTMTTQRERVGQEKAISL